MFKPLAFEVRAFGENNALFSTESSGVAAANSVLPNFEDEDEDIDPEVNARRLAEHRAALNRRLYHAVVSITNASNRSGGSNGSESGSANIEIVTPIHPEHPLESLSSSIASAISQSQSQSQSQSRLPPADEDVSSLMRRLRRERDEREQTAERQAQERSLRAHQLQERREADSRRYESERELAEHLRHRMEAEREQLEALRSADQRHGGHSHDDGVASSGGGPSSSSSSSSHHESGDRSHSASPSHASHASASHSGSSGLGHASSHSAAGSSHSHSRSHSGGDSGSESLAQLEDRLLDLLSRHVFATALEKEELDREIEKVTLLVVKKKGHPLPVNHHLDTLFNLIRRVRAAVEGLRVLSAAELQDLELQVRAFLQHIEQREGEVLDEQDDARNCQRRLNSHCGLERSQCIDQCVVDRAVTSSSLSVETLGCPYEIYARCGSNYDMCKHKKDTLCDVFRK